VNESSTDSLPLGAVFKTPEGAVAVSRGTTDGHVEDAHGKRWPVGACTAVEHADEIPACARCSDEEKVHNPENRPGFAVSCLCVRSWGGKGQLWTPCCGSVKRGLLHGDAAKCNSCGNWWRVFFGAESKIVWLGRRKPCHVKSR